LATPGVAKAQGGHMKKRESSYEDLQNQIKELETPVIEIWRNQYSDRDYSIHLENPEFTCICPNTGLPDFARIIIDYNPGEYCIELKSFKMYCIFYRDVGIFHEHLVNKILDDFVTACNPRWAEVKVMMNPRGGIETVVKAEYQNMKKKEGRKNGKNRWTKS